jgi:NAD-dependent SIR2 family protein deacetylase
LTVKLIFPLKGNLATAGASACPSCGKRDMGNGRYCIHCGSILRPVYCSYCGTVNPDDLEQCLECGNPIPRLTDIRWRPIVTVMQPTSAMSNENLDTDFVDSEATVPTEQSSRKDLLSRLRQWLDRTSD